MAYAGLRPSKMLARLLIQEGVQIIEVARQLGHSLNCPRGRPPLGRPISLHEVARIVGEFT